MKKEYQRKYSPFYQTINSKGKEGENKKHEENESCICRI